MASVVPHPGMKPNLISSMPTWCLISFYQFHSLIVVSFLRISFSLFPTSNSHFAGITTSTIIWFTKSVIMSAPVSPALLPFLTLRLIVHTELFLFEEVASICLNGTLETKSFFEVLIFYLLVMLFPKINRFVNFKTNIVFWIHQLIYFKW